MYEDTEKFIDLDFEQQVRQAAYHLWEDVRPDGEEKKYWFKALERLLEKQITVATSADGSLDSIGGSGPTPSGKVA